MTYLFLFFFFFFFTIFNLVLTQEEEVVAPLFTCVLTRVRPRATLFAEGH